MNDAATEADTCRKFLVPKLLAAGWDTDPYSIAERNLNARCPYWHRSIKPSVRPSVRRRLQLSNRLLISAQ
jgi:hypothetical protein